MHPKEIIKCNLITAPSPNKVPLPEALDIPSEASQELGTGEIKTRLGRGWEWGLWKPGPSQCQWRIWKHGCLYRFISCAYWSTFLISSIKLPRWVQIFTRPCCKQGKYLSAFLLASSAGRAEGGRKQSGAMRGTLRLSVGEHSFIERDLSGRHCKKKKKKESIMLKWCALAFHVLCCVYVWVKFFRNIYYI